MSRLLLVLIVFGFVLVGQESRSDVGYCTGRCYDNGNGVIFAGAGFDYVPFLQFSLPRRATYEGMGAAAEIGFDIPSSDSFGYRIIVDGGYLNLLNKANRDTASEVGTKQSIGSRVALMFGGLSLGLGGRYSSIEIRQVSQNVAPVKQSYDATSAVFALAYSLKANERIGFTLNSQYERAVVGSARFQSGSLQLLLHFSLLVR